MIYNVLYFCNISSFTCINYVGNLYYRHSLWAQLAKQETLTPPEHLVSSMVSRSMIVHYGTLLCYKSDSVSLLCILHFDYFLFS